jgi:hypothetical protein
VGFVGKDIDASASVWVLCLIDLEERDLMHTLSKFVKSDVLHFVLVGGLVGLLFGVNTSISFIVSKPTFDIMVGML